MDDIGALHVLKQYVAGFRTQAQAAAALGITQPYLTDLLRGRRALSDRILESLGLAREVTIVAKKG